MNSQFRTARIFAIALGLAAALAFPLQAPAGAQPVAAPPTASTPPASAIDGGSVKGTVVDAQRRPLPGATIEASGLGKTTYAATAGDGSFSLVLPPGVYTIAVRKTGFQSADNEGIAVLAGGSTALTVTLSEISSSNLRVIGSVTSRTAARSSIAAVSSLPLGTLLERQSTTLQEVLPEIPGVTFNRGTSVDPYEFFAVRGGLTETRVQLDGHPVSPAVGGRWNLAEINPQVFGGVDVFKGAGIDGANAGESVFGTVNLRTRDFTAKNRNEVQLGIDEYGAQFSTFAFSGNLLKENRLSYVLNYNVAGTHGPEDGALVNAVLTDPAFPGQALVGYQDTLNDRVKSTSELLKLRYRLSDATSLTGAFIGFQGTQNPQGIAYGTSVGAVQIVQTLDGQYNAPYAQNLIGQTVTGYQWYPGTKTFINEPFFEAELRTAFKNDTILVRPYTGVVDRIVDGGAEVNYTAPQFGEAWSLNPDGTYSPNLGSNYQETEVNRLHGATFTYLHPYGENNVLNFSYDYHSDYSSSYYGDPNPATNVANTVNGDTWEISVAPSTARTHSLSLSTVLQLNPKFKLALGDYQTSWKLDYLVEDPALIAANPTVDLGDLPISLVPRARSYAHNDPHFGLNYRPNSNFALRFSAGSGITVPYASQVSGLPSVGNASGTSNGEATLNNVNPNLSPESTVAYGLGADFVLPNKAQLQVDLFHNTVHDPFLLSTYPATSPAGSPRPYDRETQWLNGPILRAYGIELALKSPERLGWGYNATATFERAYYDQIPQSFYVLAASNALDGAQLNGDNIIPYAQAHGEINYATKDLRVAFGSDYTGANNWTYGPAFATFFLSLQKDAGVLGKLRISADNIFNDGNGDPYGVAIQNGGFSTALLGPNSTGTGLAASSQSQALQSFTPRTFRFSLVKSL